MSLDPRGIVSSIKTLDLVADQSSATNLTYPSKFRKSKIYKVKSAADFFDGPPKINRGTYDPLVFFKMAVMDIH